MNNRHRLYDVYSYLVMTTLVVGEIYQIIRKFEKIGEYDAVTLLPERSYKEGHFDYLESEIKFRRRNKFAYLT